MTKNILGIDLGTSHSTLTMIDDKGEAQILSVPQLVGPAEIAEDELLPSVLYHPKAHESLSLPWQPQARYAIGKWALDMLAENPERCIGSAKSWLCYQRQNHSELRLPPEASWEGLTALEVSAAVLDHLLSAWEFKSGQLRSSIDQLILTVPASFDPYARQLTEQAAALAGIPQLQLFEEPLAAFYHWLATEEQHWNEVLKHGDSVLICDVGGGTCDFSLISVRDSEDQLQLERIAVGRHLLLGGDNMDLALAHALAATQADIKLDRWQFQHLLSQARRAKEALLQEADLEIYPISIASRGSNLFAQALRFDVPRAMVEELLVEGFFPMCKPGDKPERSRGLALQGQLPYEADAAITKHLAAFLQRAASNLATEQNSLEFLKPTHILFNGGVFHARSMRQRLKETLESWCNSPVIELANTNLGSAVALGAAYYGLWQTDNSKLRVKTKAARSYYLGLESNAPAVPGLKRRLQGLCVLPLGTEEGSHLELTQHELGLWPGESISFKLFASDHRASDQVGTLVADADDELDELAEVSSSVEADSEGPIPVVLTSDFDATGNLALGIREHFGDRRWTLNFTLREHHA